MSFELFNYEIIILYTWLVISLSIGKDGTKGSKPVQGASLIQHTCYNDKIAEQRTIVTDNYSTIKLHVIATNTKFSIQNKQWLP